MTEKFMLSSYEIDYHGRPFFLGTSKTLKDALRLEKKALRKSNGEFPTFTENGKKCIAVNGEVLEK